MLVRLLIVLFVYSFSIFSIVAFSQESVKVTNEKNVYDDWTARCRQVEGSPEQCILQQQIFTAKTKQWLIEISIARVGEKEKKDIITFSLPLRIFLPEGMQLYFDDVLDRNIPIAYCDQAGCYINLELEDALVNKIIESKKASIRITSIRDRSKPIRIPFSGKGFKKALMKLN